MQQQAQHPLELPLVMESAPGPQVTLSGREYLYFAGTGYLGLQGHPAVIEAGRQALLQFGVHTATTRSGFGNCPPVLEVEQRAADFFAADEACYAVSGYAVNFAVAAAISDDVDLVFVDESAHDCLREATRWLTQLQRPAVSFAHRSPEHLGELLASHVQPGQRMLVMTDGVFAASGRLAPLSDYLEVLASYPNSKLLVDDAHATAVMGTHGRGTVEHFGINPAQINVHTNSSGPAIYHGTTLSKAIGGHGGAIVGSRAFLERVRMASGWFRGASAPAAPVAAATAKALEIVAQQPELRAKLASNIVRVRQSLRTLGLQVDDSPAAIVSFQLASAAEMQRVHQALLSEGIAVGYTRNYAGAGADGMLRVAVFATHTLPMLDQLAATLGRVL